MPPYLKNFMICHSNPFVFRYFYSIYFSDEIYISVQMFDKYLKVTYFLKNFLTWKPGHYRM